MTCGRSAYRASRLGAGTIGEQSDDAVHASEVPGDEQESDGGTEALLVPIRYADIRSRSKIDAAKKCLRSGRKLVAVNAADGKQIAVLGIVLRIGLDEYGLS